MKIIAHRCGTDQYPELTIDAARYSLQLGADYVELDIQYTKDQIPVICHDQDALYLFGDSANISSLSLKQFTAMRYVRDRRYKALPLKEFLLNGIAPLVLHIKAGGECLKHVLELLHHFKYEDKVMLGVTVIGDVQMIKSFNQNIKILAFAHSGDQVAEFIHESVDIIRLWENWVENGIIRRIHEAGKQVWVMAGSPELNTVGYTDVKNIMAWKQMGADGILANEIKKITSLFSSNL